MAGRGGLDGLNDAQRAQAERAFSRWSERHPDMAARHGMAGYVTHVQGYWTEAKARTHDLNQLARQMARYEECRAASQFLAVEPPPSSSSDSAPKGRYSPAFRQVVDVFDMVHRRTVRQAAADMRAASDEDKESGGRWDRFRAFWRNRMHNDPGSNMHSIVDDKINGTRYDNRPATGPKPGRIDP